MAIFYFQRTLLFFLSLGPILILKSTFYGNKKTLKRAFQPYKKFLFNIYEGRKKNAYEILLFFYFQVTLLFFLSLAPF